MDGKFRITQHALGRLRESLRSCPGCVNGFEVDPNLCGQDRICRICHGVKVVSLIPCRCGRPLRLDTKGEVVEGVFCCGYKACRQAMQPKEEFAQTVYYNAQAWHNKPEGEGWTFMGH